MSNLFDSSPYDRRLQRALNARIRSLYDVPQEEVPEYFMELLGLAEEQQTRQQPDQSTDTKES